MRIEFHAWPPSRYGGQQVARTHTGVLAIDMDTGVAVYVCSERSHRGNQRLAEERVRLIMGEAVSPGGWTR